LSIVTRDIRIGAPAVWPSAAEFLISRVPAVSARTLALCRALLGLGILYFWLWSEPSGLSRLAAHSRPLPFTDLINVGGWLTALSASAGARAFVFWSVAALALAFAAGAAMRVTAPALTALMWISSCMAQRGHFMTPLLLGMTTTMFAPWGAAWSVDAARRRAAADAVASPYYGYAPWLLGLCIGLAYASAGLSKLWMTEGAWLWETGARNGFIQDVGRAPTQLGVWISNDYWLAVGASVFSSFGQIAYLYACFTRSEWIKYAICFGIALPFLVGLAVTMGLFWWPWVLLVMILYAPWQRIDRRLAASLPRSTDFPPANGRQRAGFVYACMTLIGIHVLAVLTAREYEPLVSNYPMYVARMGAGSDEEADLMRVLVQRDRNARHTIHLLLDDGTEHDVSSAFFRARIFYDAYLYASPYAFLRRRGWECGSAAGIDPRTVAIRYGRARFSVENGTLAWGPVEQVRTLDCGSPRRSR
jgi:hypothetical protein